MLLYLMRLYQRREDEGVRKKDIIPWKSFNQKPYTLPGSTGTELPLS